MKGRDAVLVALVAGTGLRIGEALAIRPDDFDPVCRLLQVRRSVWRRREQAPKTLNAIRPVDIPESLAQVLCRYIKGRKGHLFTTRAGRLLDSRNVLDVLQQAGRQGGYHAFRRFRFAVLRKAEVPVVASNAGGLPEVIEHGSTGFMHDPDHIAGFVASALRLLGNEKLRRSMGRRARRVAIERFDPGEMVARYIKVYDSLR